jgi:rhodanese-related sulfurtransferase
MTTSLNDPTERLAMPRSVSAATARRRHNAGALLVDIRPQVARHQGSITGALLIDPATIADQITDRHREIVLCRLGYDRVLYLAGGYAAWHHRATTR